MAESDADANAPGLRQRRTSTKSTDTVIHAVKSIERKAEKALLLLWDDLPAWRRDNAYIRSGYRESRASYWHSFRSLFYLHNESVNIWSHLIGALLAISCSVYLFHFIRPRYSSASSSDILVFTCFFGGAVLCLGMSATYHALVGHSAEVARWGNKLDYTGIVFLIVGSFVPTLYYGFFCKPAFLTLYLTAICTLGVGCVMVSWLERFRTPAWRPYRALMFIALGLSGVFPAVHGVAIYGLRGLEDRMSLSWVVLQGVTYIVGAALYAFRWPERSLPGAFDIWGSSHQIFHVFVVLAATAHLHGLTKAFDHHHMIMRSQC